MVDKADDEDDEDDEDNPFDFGDDKGGAFDSMFELADGCAEDEEEEEEDDDDDEQDGLQLDEPQQLNAQATATTAAAAASSASPAAPSALGLLSRSAAHTQDEAGALARRALPWVAAALVVSALWAAVFGASSLLRALGWCVRVGARGLAHGAAFCVGTALCVHQLRVQRRIPRALLVPQRARVGCTTCLLLLLDCLLMLGSRSEENQPSVGGALSEMAAACVTVLAVTAGSLLVPALAICILSPSW